MKILKYHDNIANLLGWVNKNNFVCTILELTHTNLLRYVSQLKDGLDICENGSTVCLLPFKQYLKIITQITDAMVGFVYSFVGNILYIVDVCCIKRFSPS